MDPWASIPSSSCDTELKSSQTEAEQDPSTSWLDLVDWTLLDADAWASEDINTNYNGNVPENYNFHNFDGQFDEGDTTTSTIPQYHSTPGREHPHSDAPITEKMEFRVPDRPDLSVDNSVSKDDRLEKAWRPERGSIQPVEIPVPGARSAVHPSPSPRRKGRLSDLVRKGMEELKHAKGACWRCKILRKKCDVDQPCRACPRRGGQSAWQLIGCQRGRLEMQIKMCLRGPLPCLVSLQGLQEKISQCLSIATSRCNMETQNLQNDRNCSTVTPFLEVEVSSKGKGVTIIRNPARKAQFIGSESRLITCSGCSACLQSIKVASSTHGQYDFRKRYIKLLWELIDIPATIPELKIGSISQIRELLKAASRYAAGAGDVDKLIILSLECFQNCLELWRLHSHGLFYHGMHESCLTSREQGCRYKCFADLQHGIQQYTSELSKVFFRKKALQSDRRWWLSVFYSLFIQGSVRQTLLMVQAETNGGYLVNDPSPTLCKEYCYTALNIFDAASAGWDPISSDKDLGQLLLGSDIDKKVAKHITVARETVPKGRLGEGTHDSFDLLRDIFEMDMSMRVHRRTSIRITSSKDSTAKRTQHAFLIDNVVGTPQLSDTEYTSEDQIDNDDSETGIHTPLRRLRFAPSEGIRGYKVRTNKRRATSPPQGDDNERRPSTDSFPQSLPIEEDISDRANSMSSMNSFSSINAAYGTLALDSPGSGQSSRMISSSPHPDNMQQSDTSRTMSSHDMIRQRAATKTRGNSFGKAQGFSMCDCCPKKPRKFDTHEELVAHEAEKQYECAYCGKQSKNKNEAERHTNALHNRGTSWSCSLLSTFDRVFFDSRSQQGQADTCGFCGVDFDRTASTKYARYPSDDDWEKRIAHLREQHKFRECNFSKNFYRFDHFRQHLKHSHGAVLGDWTKKLERVCMEKGMIPEDDELWGREPV